MIGEVFVSLTRENRPCFDTVKSGFLVELEEVY